MQASFAMSFPSQTAIAPPSFCKRFFMRSTHARHVLSLHPCLSNSFLHCLPRTLFPLLSMFFFFCSSRGSLISCLRCQTPLFCIFRSARSSNQPGCSTDSFFCYSFLRPIQQLRQNCVGYFLVCWVFTGLIRVLHHSTSYFSNILLSTSKLSNSQIAHFSNSTNMSLSYFRLNSQNYHVINDTSLFLNYRWNDFLNAQVKF